MNDQASPDCQVYFQDPGIHVRRSGNGRQGPKWQHRRNSGGGALQIAVTIADTYTGEVAHGEVDRFRVAGSSTQVTEKRDEVIELPAGEILVAFPETCVIHVLDMQFIASPDLLPELVCRCFFL